MTEVPHYNTRFPATLFQAGTLRGEPIHLVASSITPPTRSCRVFTASLSQPLSTQVRRDGVPGKVAIKIVSASMTTHQRPHNVVREIRSLASCDHPNILSLLNAYLSQPTLTTPESRYSLFTPLYPLTLRALLDTASFAPPSSSYLPLSLSLSHQLLSAVDHLHSHSIAHRDLNPSNIVLASNARLVLIDFGCSILCSESGPPETDDDEKGLEHDFGTLPYRAPELVFASRTYSPIGVDRWGLGCTMAEFWTPFFYEPTSPNSRSLSSSSSSDDDDDEDDGFFEQEESSSTLRIDRHPPPRRETLFDLSSSSNATDFVLISCIFRHLGTPTLRTWPEANDLPSFGYFTFKEYERRDIKERLRLLPNELDWFGRIIGGLVRISSRERWEVKRCLDEEGWDQVEVISFEDSRLGEMLSEHI